MKKITFIPKTLNKITDVFMILHTTDEQLYNWLIERHLYNQGIVAAVSKSIPSYISDDKLYEAMEDIKRSMKHEYNVEFVDLYKQDRVFFVSATGEVMCMN